MGMKPPSPLWRSPLFSLPRLMLGSGCYYLCDAKGCADYRKSIRRDVIEGEFEDLLQDLRPSANLFSMAFEISRDLWTAKEEAVDQDRASIARQLKQTDRKFQQLIEGSISIDYACQPVIEHTMNKIMGCGTWIIRLFWCGSTRSTTFHRNNGLKPDGSLPGFRRWKA